MDIEKILKRFHEMSGTEFDNTSKYFALCEEALNEIKLQIKEDADVEQNENILNSAAAALAFYKYTLLTASNTPPEALTAAADIKNAISSAEKIWKGAKSSICSLSKDPEFMFERVVTM